MSEQGPYSHQPQNQPSNHGWGQTPPPPPPGTYSSYVNEEMIPTQRSSQPPPSGYFSPPPMTPVYPVVPPSGPPEPPRIKHDRSLFVVIGLVVAVLLIVLGAVGTLAIMSWRTASNPTPPVTKTPTTTNNSTPGPNVTPTVGKTPINTLNQRYPIGQTVDGKVWQITANNVRTSNGDDFLKASKGKIFVLIDVTVKNISPKPETVSSLLMFKLRGTDEVEYIESITTFNKPPDGEVAPGATIKGTLAFEVPVAQRDFLFVFLPEPLGGKEEVIWEVRVAK